MQILYTCLNIYQVSNCTGRSCSDKEFCFKGCGGTVIENEICLGEYKI